MSHKIAALPDGLEFVAVTPDLLELIQPNAHGQRYQAIIFITGPSGKTKRIKTIWIVLFGEVIARFVTAVPQRRKKNS